MSIIFIAIISIFVWIILLVPYELFLRHNKHFGAQRIYLLIAIFTGPVLGYLKTFSAYFFQKASILNVFTLPFPIQSIFISSNISYPEASKWNFDINSFSFWLAIYLVFVFCQLGYLLYRLLEISSIIQSNPFQIEKKQKIIYTPSSQAPFSFFSYIFLGKDIQYDDKTREAILLHESTHTSQWHSIDILILEIVTCFTWFLPISIWYKHRLKEIHEYLADQNTVKIIPQNKYGLILLEQSMNITPLFSHAFADNDLKKRFLRLKQKPSSSISKMHFLILIPAILICNNLLFGFNLIISKSPITKDILTEEDKRQLLNQSYVNISPNYTITPNHKKTIENIILPSFGGGNNELNQYINENLHISSIDQKQIRVRLFIEKSGKVQHVQILDKLKEDAETQLHHLFMNMPKWTPAISKGKNVASFIEFPLEISK